MLCINPIMKVYRPQQIDAYTTMPIKHKLDLTELQGLSVL